MQGGHRGSKRTHWQWLKQQPRLTCWCQAIGIGAVRAGEVILRKQSSTPGKKTSSISGVV